MNPRRLLVGLAALMTACATPHGQAQQTAIEAATAALEQLQREGFVGSALAACGDAIWLSQSYGYATAPPAPPSYWVASISKQFTAAAILRLAEEGRLGLEDPLSRFFSWAPADKADITLMQLLTHQSGLPQAYAADGVREREAAARAILSLELAAAPGSRFGYANDNYSLLAIIVEFASGRDFESYVSEELFAPAGMRQTGFWPEEGEDFVPPTLNRPAAGLRQANWGFRGGTGMRASVEDLHQWSRALDEGLALSPWGVRQLFGPHVRLTDGRGVGFNWFWTIAEPSLLYTSGSESYGPNARLYRAPGSGLVLVAATNAGPPEASGPGWSRRAGDALVAAFAAEASTLCPA